MPTDPLGWTLFGVVVAFVMGVLLLAWDLFAEYRRDAEYRRGDEVTTNYMRVLDEQRRRRP